MASVKFSNSEVFSLMNKLKKTMGITQKEAYALAKMKLMTDASASNDITNVLLEKMSHGNVKFTFINKGREITTTGTLDMSKVPSNRKVEGSKIPKHDDMVVFYDVRHGVYRQFDKTKVVKIHNTKE